MAPELARAAMIFLQRVMVHASEVPTYSTVMAELGAAANPQPQPEAPRRSSIPPPPPAPPASGWRPPPPPEPELQSAQPPYSPNFPKR